MEQTTPQRIMDLIPRQSTPAAEEHWLVRRLHEERRAADHARLSALLAASGTPSLGARASSAGVPAS